MGSPPLVTRGSLALLGLILLIGTGLRLAVYAHAPVFIVPHDSAQFYGAAYDLAYGQGFDLPLKRAPLYPLFLSGVIATLGPQPERAAFVQHLLGLVAVVLTYLLGALAFGRTVGLLAALGMAINGALLLLEQSLLSETIYMPLLLGCLLLLLAGLRSGQRRWFPAVGLLLGLAALNRPVSQAILPLALLAIVLALRGWRPRLVAIGLVCLGYGLVVTPWLIRNRAVHGTAAISAGLGDALFGRVHYYDQAFDFRDYGQPPADPQQARVRARVFELAQQMRTGPELRTKLRQEFGLSDAQSDAALREASLQVARQEPGRFVLGTLGYFVRLSLFYDDPVGPLWRSRLRQDYERAWPDDVRDAMEAAPQRPESDRAVLEAIARVYQDRQAGVLIGLLFALGTLRCLLAGPRRGLWLLPLIAVLQILLYVALDGLQTRFRTPLQPLILITAAAGGLLVVEQARAWLAARRISGSERHATGRSGAWRPPEAAPDSVPPA